MGSAVSIIATIRGVDNNFTYMPCNDTIAIDCSKAEVRGQWFLVPFVNPNTGIGYAKYAEQQSVFDVKVVEVWFNGRTYFLSGELSEYTDDCNECCGSTPELAPITVPLFIPDSTICPDGNDDYIFRWFVPNLADNQTMTLKLYSDGVLLETSDPVESPDDALTWAQDNWGSYGTWTLDDNNILVLTSTQYNNVYVSVTKDSHSYCLTVDYPFTFDQVVRDGTDDEGTTGETITYDLPTGKTVADTTGLALALTTPKNFFNDGEITHAMPGKVQYAGTGRPFTLKNNGVVVGTWHEAACS